MIYFSLPEKMLSNGFLMVRTLYVAIKKAVAAASLRIDPYNSDYMTLIKRWSKF